LPLSAAVFTAALLVAPRAHAQQRLERLLDEVTAEVEANASSRR
jgi:hypothetical protein